MLYVSVYVCSCRVPFCLSMSTEFLMSKQETVWWMSGVFCHSRGLTRNFILARTGMSCHGMPILSVCEDVCENFYINLTPTGPANNSSIICIFPRTDIKNTIVNRSLYSSASVAGVTAYLSTDCAIFIYCLFFTDKCLSRDQDI